MRCYTALALVAIAAFGCNQPSRPTVTDRMRTGTGTPETAAAENSASESPPLAAVNGRPIDRRAFLRTLVESHGLGLLQRMILRDIARQEAERLGLSVTTADVAREFDVLLEQSGGPNVTTQPWTPTRREQFIAELLRLRGWSRQELDCVMERQACLRTIVESQITLDDAMLQQEYKLQFSEKVQVRHLQLTAARFYPSIKQQLDAGADFAQLARDYSQNLASVGGNGMLPPFTEHDPDLPPALVKVAFALQPGEVSNPIEIDGACHLLKLERRIPAESPAFDDVRIQLEEAVRARLTAQRMEVLAAALLDRCKLWIHDPLIRDLYESGRRSGQLLGPALTEPQVGG